MKPTDAQITKSLIWQYRIGYRLRNRNDERVRVPSLVLLNNAYIRLAQESGLSADEFIRLDRMVRKSFLTAEGTRQEMSNAQVAVTYGDR